MTSTQKNILWATLGTLLFLVAILKKGWFGIWQAGVYLLPVFLISGVVLLSVYGSRILRLRPLRPLLVLVLLEVVLAIDLHLAAKNQRPGLLPSACLQDLYLNELRTIPFLKRTSGRYDEAFFYTLRPGKSTFENLEYCTQLNVHSSGFRTSAEDLQNGEIVFLGDSFTMGWGVEQEESFPKVMEQLSGIRTLSLGMPSFGSAREFLAWKKYRPEKPRLVVWQFCSNDIAENAAYVSDGFRLEVSPRFTYEAARRLNELQQYYYPLKYLSSLLRCGMRAAFGKTPEAPVEPWAEQFFAIVAKLREEFDGPVIIMDLESSQPEYCWQEAMKDFLREMPMSNVYLFAVNNVLSHGDYFLMDDHLNAAGHRKVANALWQFIQSNNILNPQPLEVNYPQ